MTLTRGTHIAAGALAMLGVLPVSARASQAPPAQPPAQEQHVHPAPDVATKDAPAAATPGMQAMHGMMANMHASQAKLQELVEKMNVATGPQKIEAIAALATEMVKSQHAMHEAMGAHMAEMMKMGHMQGMPNMPKGQAKP